MKISIAFVALLATAFAAPAAEPEANKKPQKPTRTTTTTVTATPTAVNQQNQCGNGATPYCCNTDNSGKYTSCSVLGAGSVCGATTVCCNANNSIQVCLGTAQIS